VLTAEGKLLIQTTFKGSDGKDFRTSVHTSLNHPVSAVRTTFGGEARWDHKRFIILSPIQGVIERNGNPYGMLPEDTFWGLGLSDGLELPEGTIIMAGSDENDTILDAYRQSQKVQVVKTSSYSPHSETPRVMQEYGIRFIPEEKFRNPKRFAHQIQAFYGLHDGLMGELAGNYVLAEGKIESMGDYEIKEDIIQFNQSSNIDERYKILVTMAQRHIFDEELSINIDTLLENEGYDDANYVAGVVRTLKGNIVPEALKDAIAGREDDIEAFKSKLLEIASNSQLQLPTLNRELLRRRLDSVRNNLDMIPPNLLGAFTLLNKELLE